MRDAIDATWGSASLDEARPLPNREAVRPAHCAGSWQSELPLPGHRRVWPQHFVTDWDPTSVSIGSWVWVLMMESSTRSRTSGSKASLAVSQSVTPWLISVMHAAPRESFVVSDFTLFWGFCHGYFVTA